MATTATPSASRRLAMTDVTNIEKNAPRQTKPSRTPARKVSLCGKATETPELFFDTTEAPNVTPSEAPAFACTPHAAPRRSTTPVLATPDERLLTNAAAEEALTAAWIAAQTAEIEALRALVRRQRGEKESLIANGAGPYATSVQRAARGCLARHRATALRTALATVQRRRRGAVPRRAFLDLRAAAIVAQNRCARGPAARQAFQTALGATITVQTAARAQRAHTAFTALRAAALIAATRARGALARRHKARQTAGAATIQRVYGRHKARVGDDAGKFARAWRLAEQQRFVLSLVLNPPKGTTVLRIRDFSRRGARQVHEAELRNGQPFGLRLVLDRDRLGCYFVSNPQGGLRQVLAPWAPEADITVTLVNQTKTRDREFVVTREELAARAASESTYSSLLNFGRGGAAVGVADLVDRATLDREFLGDNDVLVVAVTCDEPDAAPVAPPTPGSALRCVPAMNVSPGLSAFSV